MCEFNVERMMKSKVSCWFCNKESFVFIIYKNNWTCESCDQYNGFKKDGDYNKQIPEMQAENKQTYCINNTPKKSVESTNLLCARCNASQEQKLKDLNKFEAKNEDNFDEEYRIYKSKLDHIHDLCRACKTKLNQHLTRQDLQIGHYLHNDRANKPREMTPLKVAMHANKTKLAKQSNKNGVEDSDREFQIKKRAPRPKVEDSPMDTSQSYKKAYTISGSSPSTQERKNMNYTVSGSSPYSQERHNLAKRPVYEHSPKKYIYEPDLNTSSLNNGDNYAKKVDQLLTTNLMKSKDKWFVIQTICADFISFFIILLIFSCDIVNLINDSGIWENEEYNSDLQILPGADQHYIFKTLLKIYRYTQLLLAITLIVSVFYAFKRPKMSRFLSSVGILTNLLIHLNFFGNQNDEKFIMEVLVSFGLSSYLALARSYNVVQFYRYMKGEC